MSDTRNFVRVFLASPGDLKAERQAAREEVDEYNKVWAESLGYQVELVRWEDTVSRSGRPQAIINEDLDRCELFIGMLFERWGTPPAKDGQYGSGFEEEFRTSSDRRIRTGKPEIKMLFKGVDPARLADPGKELSKVIEFRNELVDTKEVYFEEFADLDQFRQRFRACISRYVQSLTKPSRLQDINDADERPKSTEPEEERPNQTAPLNPLSDEGAAFISDLLVRPPEDGVISPASVARLRLIANMIGGSLNDLQWLEAHDANLLFSHKRDFHFSSAERYALATAGFAGFKSENAPLWHWLLRNKNFDIASVAYRAFGVQDTAPRLGALAALTFLGEPLPNKRPLDRRGFLRRWFADDTPDSVKLAAISYLAEWGLPADLEFLRRELERDAYGTRTAGLEAILRIRLRDSGDAAIRELFASDPEWIDEVLLDKIYSKIDGVQTDVIREGLSRRNAGVRRHTLISLAKRNEFNLTDSQTLLADSDVRVRFEAIRATRSLGKAVSTTEAKRILAKPEILNALRNPFSDAPPPEPDRALVQVLLEEEVHSKGRKPGEELARLDVMDRGPFFAHAKRDFQRYEASIIQSLNDGYRTEFAAFMAGLESIGTTRPDLTEKARGLEGFVRGELSAMALQLLCTKGGPRALAAVRRAVERDDLSFCDGPLHFFRLHGEWEDIPRITSWSEKALTGASLLTIGRSRWNEAAEAIHAIAKNRLPELLFLDFPNALMEKLIAKTADSTFAKLPDSHIEALLDNENGGVRKNACLKCVKSLPKKRIVDILERYISREGQHYYNVIFWLDLGASAPTAVARRAAARELAD